MIHQRSVWSYYVYKNCWDSYSGMLVLITMLLVLFTTTARANDSENEKVIRHAVYTGFKELYPEGDGLIWAETLVKEIFEKEGYQVKTLELPTKRLPRALADNVIDSFISADVFLGPIRSELIHAKYPTASLAMFIYYNKTKGWKPTWPPDDIFKQKLGKSKVSEETLREDWGLNVSSSSTFDACIKMVNNGRADYWLDNITGLINATPGLAKQDSDEFSYEQMYRMPIYLFFQPDEEGRLLRDIYDRGIEAILMSGDFLRVFYRYDKNARRGVEGALAVQQIRDVFPDFSFPEQKQLEEVPAASPP